VTGGALLRDHRGLLRGRSGFVTSGRIRLHYLEYGRAGGTEVVLVPGLSMPAAIYEPVARELARDYRVFTLDLRGRGRSDKPATGFTLPDYSDDLAALIAQRRLHRPVLVGQALGARIVPAFDALHPGVASGLLIVDPPTTGPGLPPYSTPLESFQSQIREAKARPIDADDVRAHFPDWDPEALRLRAEWLDSCDENAVTQSYLNFTREDFLGYVEKVTAPALFAYGARTHAVPPEVLAELRRRNPRMAVKSVEGVGHMIPFEDREAFLKLVREFVGSLNNVRPNSP
jgi:N-formylmaleamate deformylase